MHRPAKRIVIKTAALVAAVVLAFALVTAAVALTQRRLPPPRAPKEPLVCLDAGHGGKDTGAVGRNDRYEKDDVLSLALRVRELLTERGIRVMMTREDDVFIPLEERCRKANRSRADLFVSLHRNSAPSGQGVEIWVKSTRPAADVRLAENLLSGVETVGITKNRGVKFGLAGRTGNYFVNRSTGMPSCLVELGFITDEADNALLDERADAYAAAIAGGIEKTLYELKLKLPDTTEASEEGSGGVHIKSS